MIDYRVVLSIFLIGCIILLSYTVGKVVGYIIGYKEAMRQLMGEDR